MPASQARKQVGSAVGEVPRARDRAARTDGGTCAPLPFHVTNGQLAMGQGVVLHEGERNFNQVPSLACTTTPCPTAGWPPVTWKGSDAHVPYRSKPLEPLLALLPD
ncbi:unnamed protein product [Spirodela intermedia]|uniref:Uncharacterized protein n=1 Tax=Spirodela intermedia TaxID=51605 RepID=A0A7I8J687_SPIIN|nr:unnamed protein product [Spirodela intermedia]CAA6665265.1 unnamed protein product [Spirodela intermedia]